MASELQISGRVAQWLVQLLARVMGGYAVVSGVAIITRGPRGWDEERYAIALLVPGSPLTWGVTILLGGLLVIVGSIFRRSRLIAFGLIIASAWSAFFAFALAISAINEINTGLEDSMRNAVFAVIFAVLATAFRDSSKSDLPR